MSAEILRRAAALMRERAEAATDGGHGWRSTGEERTCEVWAPRDAANHDAFMVATTLTRLNPNPSASAQADADHIASWHPAVALTVADWLDSAADLWEAGLKPIAYADDVARTYLRDADDGGGECYYCQTAGPHGTLCVDGALYGACGHDACEGACAYLADCRCPCHGARGVA